jgi:hypothetical protein
MAEARGFRLELGGSGQFKLTHNSTGNVVVFAGTPSDRRAAANARALMRRKLREIPA